MKSGCEFDSQPLVGWGFFPVRGLTQGDLGLVLGEPLGKSLNVGV